VQSFSKNFGLYGQRVGALSIVCQDPNEAKKVLSQMKTTIRPMYSNPPRHGAQLVKKILEDDRLTTDFIDQCSDMADRIGSDRIGSDQRYASEASVDLGGEWRRVVEVVGETGVTSWTRLVCLHTVAWPSLKWKRFVTIINHSIYCTLDGRISMAGVTSGNVNYIADAINDVVSKK